MFAIHLMIIASLLPTLAFAADPTIFETKKNLAMKDDDPIYRDFYIDGGAESGLQKGMIVNVMRRVTLYDSIQNRSPGELYATVSQVKIIHVQKGLAVARLFAESNRENLPLIEEDYIMIGDRVDVKSAVMESRKSARAAEEAAAAAAKRAAASEPVVKLEIKPAEIVPATPVPTTVPAPTTVTAPAASVPAPVTQ